MYAVLCACLLCSCCAFVRYATDLGILEEAVKFGCFSLDSFQIMHFQIEAQADLACVAGGIV